MLKITIIGPTGSGKSTAAAVLQDAIKARGAKAIVVETNLPGDPESGCPYSQEQIEKFEAEAGRFDAIITTTYGVTADSSKE